VAALPLASRTSLDPWSNRLRMLRTRNEPLLSAREKMPFELTPVYLHLTYQAQAQKIQLSDRQPVARPPVAGGNQATEPNR
jgi:hypothetical protein